MTKSLSDAVDGDEALLLDPDFGHHLVAEYNRGTWYSDSWTRRFCTAEVAKYAFVQWLSTLEERRAMMEETDVK